MSNDAPPPQWVEEVPYRDLEDMHRFARRWRDEHRGRWFTAAKLSRFCVLIRRAVYEAIGGLDERIGLGFFDDDDLAVWAVRAGFELAVASDLLVHHFGSRTFTGHGIDAGRQPEANARRFAEKWGTRRPRGGGWHSDLGAERILRRRIGGSFTRRRKGAQRRHLRGRRRGSSGGSRLDSSRRGPPDPPEDSVGLTPRCGV